MKGNCRKALAALVLVLALSSAALADDGVIWPDRTPPPPPTTAGVIWPGIAPPPPTTTAGTASTDGIMQTGVTSTDSVTEAALMLIQLVLTRL